MRNDVQLFAMGFLLGLTSCGSVKPAPTANLEGAQNQMPKQFKFQKTQTAQVTYLLFLPQDYETKSKSRWPLMLFLHGAGERGSNIWKVTTHGPPKHVKEHPDFPFILVSPQCPDGEHWSNEILVGLLDEVIKKYAVDVSRIYVTGLSMGGYGAWDLGLTYPEKFAAIAPICGGGQMISLFLTSREKSQALKTLGIWAFHGAKDPVVPVEESQRMVDASKRVGVRDAKLTIYPDAGHNSWTEAYNDPELYHWLLTHQRKLPTR